MPKRRAALANTVEDDLALVVDEALVSVEVTTAAGVAEDANRNEHRVGHRWKEMDESSLFRKSRKVQFADVRRIHDTAVGVLD